MKIVEQFIQSKSGNIDQCEDTFYCNEHFAIVIDGATNVSGRQFSGKSPGQLAAATIRDTFLQLNGKEDIIAIIQSINLNFQYLYKTLDIEAEILEKPYIRPSAAMIVFSKFHNKVWMIGDCQCFYNDTLYQNIKRVDQVFEEVRSIIIKGELQAGKRLEELLEKDIGFELIKPLIQKQYNFQNATPISTLSYGVVNGFSIPPELIKTLEVSQQTEFISLASDGYPRIYENLEKSEEELARLLLIDPLCIKENIGTKGVAKNNISFDDRTYLKVRIK
ncbi:hypothetical protein BN988_02262 [Oceanobacillus picturae]|uniref:Protein phosphatase 2C n=1 Tax=Oceanobacillus picturae TaxID=171693 RepID=W9ADE5_9BACI|nr:hypothetical protein [Oceanobacillus picturae]CDO03744.1 hypothetical protein BN988_02262 [Oceanobacillus picturae]